MEREIDYIQIVTLNDLPSIEFIKSIPREKILKLIFDEKINNEREKIGEKLRAELKGFSIGIHTIEPELSIEKLITEEEIISNQDFFETCAKDYRALGEDLLFRLIKKLKLKLNEDFPLETFNHLKSRDKIKGIVDDWRYFVHGYHCGFDNLKTGQIIEVPLVFGLEFGDLDPYFFTRYIESTPEYYPLPVKIYEYYADGIEIIEKMIELDKFEKIKSNAFGHEGVVVKDRDIRQIKTHEQLENEFKEKSKKENKKFSLKRFFGFEK